MDSEPSKGGQAIQNDIEPPFILYLSANLEIKKVSRSSRRGR